MKRHKIINIARMIGFSLALIWAAAACGSEDGDGNGGGGIGGIGGAGGSSAPTISNLTCTPNQIGVGQAESVNCAFQFSDADGDLVQVDVTLNAEGQKQSLGQVEVANASGLTEGQAQVTVQLQAAAAAQFALELFAIDSKGNESNTATVNMESIAGGATQ